MITALDKNSEYLINGRLFKRKDYEGASLTMGGVFFKCKLVGGISQDYETPVRNVSTDGQRKVVETLYNLDVSINDFVKIDGKDWLVERVIITENEKYEKSLGLARLRFSNKKTTLYLVEVEQ